MKILDTSIKKYMQAKNPIETDTASTLTLGSAFYPEFTFHHPNPITGVRLVAFDGVIDGYWTTSSTWGNSE